MIKKALLIGTSKLIGLDTILNLWNCRECENLFHLTQDTIFVEIDCPLCKKKIMLEDILNG